MVTDRVVPIGPRAWEDSWPAYLFTMNLPVPFHRLILILLLGSSLMLKADTTTVQTFTFEAQNNPETAYDSPGRRWFPFPASDNGIEYGKVLMEYTLKCFEDGTAGNLGFACGEWDYLSYTYLFDHTGMLDSTMLKLTPRAAIAARLATMPRLVVNRANSEPATSRKLARMMNTIATTAHGVSLAMSSWVVL